MVRKSSILNAGQAKDRTRVEYLGEGGFMELKANQLQTRTLDCTISDNENSIMETQWYFSELFDDRQNLDFYDYKDCLSWCVNILNSSSTAKLMLKEASEKDWQVTLDDLNGGDYCIDVEQKLLILDNNMLDPCSLLKSNYFKNALLVTMVKALRDIWQEKRYGGFDEFYSSEYILLLERVRAADLDVMAVMIAWELRLGTYLEGWKHIIGSDIGDLAMVYSGYLERDHSALFNGRALLATFKQWFRSAQRLDDCDHDVLEYMDDVINSTHISNPFGRKSPSKMNIEVLSCLPDKSAYLQGMGTEILNNPMFSAIDNEINQTHLFHIMHDLETIMVENVPFRDAGLAQKIFPL